MISIQTPSNLQGELIPIKLPVLQDSKFKTSSHKRLTSLLQLTLDLFPL